MDPEVATHKLNRLGAQTESPATGCDAARELGFTCSQCHKAFKTKIGLGVHTKRTHPIEANAGVAPAQEKRRWRDEEVALMARAEAKVIVAKGSCGNQELIKELPDFGRSLEAIKGKRRAEAYKTLVRNFLAELEASRGEPSTLNDTSHTSIPSNDVRCPVPVVVLTEAEEPTSSAPLQVESGAEPWDKSMVECRELDEVVEGLLKAVQQRKSRTRSFAKTKKPSGTTNEKSSTRAKHENLTTRQRRRKEYAMVQELYKKCRGRAAREIIDGQHGGVRHSLQELESYWRPVLEAVSQAPGPSVVALESLETEIRARTEGTVGLDCSQLWSPITVDEVKATRVDPHSAPGPDGIRPADWNTVPVETKAKLFTSWLLRGEIPERLRQCRTIFVPKKDVPADPSEYRPISIASIPLRHLHTILARRLLACCPPDTRQRGFICADGTLENSAVLDAVLGDSRKRLRECHVAVLDFSKAFDTVSHAALIELLRRRGLPGQFCDYVARLYETATTILAVGDDASDPVTVGRGVRQGDPLSPLLFNMAMDLVLANLPQDVGYRLEREQISALAYADDLVLLAGSRVGMQASIDAVGHFGQMMGLKLNHAKSSVLSMVPDGKHKKVHYLSTRTFKVGKRWLKQVSCVERWRYLGIDFQSTGSATIEQDISQALTNIRRAPLKPQQRLEILRDHLVPRFLHGLVLGTITDNRLRMLDVQIRKAVRVWLRLPADVPTAYFHANIKDGGLAIPSLRSVVPDLILRRFGRLEFSEWSAARAASRSERIQRKLIWAGKLFAKLSHEDPKTGLRSAALYWRKSLHSSVDGFELRESTKCPASTKWIGPQSGQYTGSDYVQFVHTHINALPSRIRNSRGRRLARESELNCRAGCMVRETTAHTIQQCVRTHGGRILRHNKVAQVLKTAMVEEGWTVEEEPRVQTTRGLRKPDIIAVKDGAGVIVDVQVVSGQRPLDDAHRDKRAKYGNHDELVEKVAGRLGLTKAQVRTTSCTLSWRGVWSLGSYNELKKLLRLKEAFFQVVPGLVLRGSHMNWNRFNKLTCRTTTGSAGRSE